MLLAGLRLRLIVVLQPDAPRAFRKAGIGVKGGVVAAPLGKDLLAHHMSCLPPSSGRFLLGAQVFCHSCNESVKIRCLPPSSGRFYVLFFITAQSPYPWSASFLPNVQQPCKKSPKVTKSNSRVASTLTHRPAPTRAHSSLGAPRTAAAPPARAR